MTDFTCLADIPLSPQDRMRFAISSLPNLTPDLVPLDECCPICLIPFQTFFDESPKPSTFDFMSIIDKTDNTHDRGVTKLDGCGHIFCRKDLNEWISGFHGTCPICRHSFLDIRPPSDSDDESSDGGEWLPPPDEEEEDIMFEPDTDAFTDVEDDFGYDEMDLEILLPTEPGFGYEDMETEEERGMTDGDTSWEGDLMSISENSLREEDTEISDVDEEDIC